MDLNNAPTREENELDDQLTTDIHAPILLYKQAHNI